MKEKLVKMGSFKKVLLGVFMAGIAFLGSAVFGGANTQVASADTVTEVKPFALYEFEDESNIGKDTSGNGFDLKSLGTTAVAADGDDNYLSLTGEGGLYAPALSPNKDFSDYITGSFTVRMVFRSSKKGGAQYLLTTANYTNAFTVVNHSHAFQVITRNNDFEEERDKNSKLEFAQDVTEWIDLVIVGDAVNEKATAYVNGVQKGTVDTKILFSRDPMSGIAGCTYTFCLGMQANTAGGGAAQKSICDYKKVEVYNCALTATNVNELYASGAYNGKATVASGTKYVKEINQLDSTAYNFNLTDVNTFDKIVETLPVTLPVTLSDSTEGIVKVKWLSDSTTKTLKGILMDDGYLNAKQLVYEIECKTKVIMHYNPDLVSVSDVKIDGSTYTLGESVDKEKYELTFKITANEHVILESATYHQVSWEISQDGIASVDVKTGGAEIYIKALPRAYKVTYHDDEIVLGVSRYTYMGDEVLYQWDKEGYTFGGWYTDESLRDEFVLNALPYSAPANLNLYAKFVKNTVQEPVSVSFVNDNSKGTVSGISAESYEVGTNLNVEITALDGFVISKIKWGGNEMDFSTQGLTSTSLNLTVEGATSLEITYAEAAETGTGNQGSTSGCSGSVNVAFGGVALLLMGVCLFSKRLFKKEN